LKYLVDVEKVTLMGRAPLAGGASRSEVLYLAVEAARGKTA
jgi:hypothetical protein